MVVIKTQAREYRLRADSDKQASMVRAARRPCAGPTAPAPQVRFRWQLHSLLRSALAAPGPVQLVAASSDE
jgi:hypothetical protein